MPKVLQKWLQGCKNYTKRPGGLRGAIKLKSKDFRLKSFFASQNKRDTYILPINPFAGPPYCPFVGTHCKPLPWALLETLGEDER